MVDIAHSSRLPTIWKPADLITRCKKIFESLRWLVTTPADIKKFSRRDFRPDIWKRVEDNASYQACGYDDPAAFAALKEQLLQALGA